MAYFRTASHKTASIWAGAALPVLLLLTPVSGCGASRQIHKGDAALAEGHLSSANQAYRAALARTPGEPRALLGMARVALDDHDPEAAIVPARGAYEAGAKGAAVASHARFAWWMRPRRSRCPPLRRWCSTRRGAWTCCAGPTRPRAARTDGCAR